MRFGATRIGAAVRRVRYAVGDVAFALGRAARPAATVIQRRWRGLSMPTRRRLAAAAGGLVLLLGVLGVRALAGSDSACTAAGCPGEDQAIALVPADALAYVHLDLDPASEQYANAARLASRVPDLTRQIVGLGLAQFLGAGGRPSDFASDISPWFGGEAALAVLPGSGRGTVQLQMIEVGDGGERGALAYASRIASGRTRTRTYHGVAITLDERDLASAVVGRFLVIGRQTAVRRVADVTGVAASAPALAADGLARETRARLPADRVADAYVAAGGLRPVVGSGGLVPALEPLIDTGASRAVAVAFAAGEDNFELATRSVLDPERARARSNPFAALAPFDPALVDRAQADALAYFGVGDRGKGLKGLLAGVGVAGGRSARALGGLDRFLPGLTPGAAAALERELLPALAGEVALAVVPRPAASGVEQDPSQTTLPPGAGATPYLELLAGVSDEAKAKRALSRLERPLARALGVRPSFADRRLGDAEARVLRLSPSAELAYAVFDSIAAIAGDPAGVAGLSSGSGPSLAGDDVFRRATDGLPGADALFGYLNLAGLLAYAERTGFAANPAYATFAADLRKLEGLGLAIRSSTAELDADARLLISSERTERPTGTD